MEIQWFPGKCLTHKVLKKNPKKGSMNAKPITKTERYESFFNFFNPPEVPEDDEDIDEDMVWQAVYKLKAKNKYETFYYCSSNFICFFKQANELLNQMEQDFDVGWAISLFFWVLFPAYILFKHNCLAHVTLWHL